MARTSLKKKPANKTTDKEKNVKTQEATAPDTEALALVDGGEDTAVTQYTPRAEVGKVAGDIDKSDIKFPKIELVYGVGAVSENFDAGDIVFNGDLKLAGKGEPVQMTVISLSKYYQEALPFDPSGEVRPRIFATKEEVAEAGLWVEWRNREKPPVNECATILVAVEASAEADDSVFPLFFTEEDGTERAAALAMWTVRNTSYTRVAKQIISAQAFFLSETLLKGRWELKTERSKVGDFVTTIPKFRCIGNNTPEYQEFLARCLG